ncbi:MAG: helix-turn-helix transcriptional regulator [Prevotella sp.]|nr:helix-turn-helix transcriptional regulator [Prevotella sp.]
MECVEFYKTPEGDIMYKHVGEPVKELTPQGREMVSQLLDLIRTRYPGAFKDLSELYTVSEPNRWVFEFKIVSRFLRCNVGEFDNMHLDIDEDGFFHFEEVGCPLRGECRHEGVICKPKMDTKLTAREEEILQHIARGKQSQEIADELCISPLTVNRHRENIKAKLNVRSVAQMVSWYYEHVKK